MSKDSLTNKFDKLVWIELIGFDNTKPDFGVGELLSRMKIKPSKMALLLCDTELLHAHRGLEEDFKIGAQHCSYVARPYNTERKRQDDWTAFQLRELNRTLQRNGIEVYAAFFDYVMFKESAEKRGIDSYDVWNQQHKELLFTQANGTTFGSICHFKHLSDGRLYEDFLAEQLPAFLTDYCFDGWLACDGFAHPRLPIYKGDFSDDVTGQFESFSCKKLPKGTVAERSAFILGKLRYEWMQFCVKRQGEFIWKTVSAAKSAGKKVIAFNAWTRDPFEAIWRYGTDYRDIRDAGVDGMVVECCAGVITLEGWNHGEDAEMLDKNRATILRISAFLPELPLIQLFGVKDDCEEYCVLRHSPTMAATEVQVLGAMQSAVTGEKCLSGELVCLGDAIEKSEWHFLDDTMKSIFDIDCGSPMSPLLLWSDKAMERELKAYSNWPVCNSFRITSELIANGLPLSLCGDAAAALANPERPVLVIHPLAYDGEALDAIKGKCKCVLFIGILDKFAFGARIFIDGKLSWESIESPQRNESTEEPTLFWYSQPDEVPSKSFWRKVVSKFSKLCSPFSPSKSFTTPMSCFDSRNIRLIPFENGLLFATNMSKDYMPANVLCNRTVLSAESLTFYPAAPVRIVPQKTGSLLAFKIPPLGTAILRLKFN